MTVKRQILIILIAFSVIPTLTVVTIWAIINLSTIENLHINRLNAITHTSASAFSEIVGLKKDKVSLLASSWSLLDYISTVEQYGSDSPETQEAHTAVKRHFSMFVESIDAFDDVVLLNANGEVIIGYNPETIGKDLSGADYFDSMVNRLDPNYVFISKVHDSLTTPHDPGFRCLALSKAFINEEGKLIGVLVAYVNANIIAEFSKNITFGNTGLAFVVDSNNYILYHPKPRFYNSYVSAPQLVNLMLRYNQGEIPQTGLVDDIVDGNRRVFYYEVIPECELTLILQQDYSEFSEFRKLSILFSVLSCVIIAILAVIFGYKYADYFVKPIRQLKGAFSSGEREGSYIICDLPQKNELGDLARSYNTMIQKLEYQFELVNKEKEKNEYNALHDRITGLYNRVAFEQIFSGRMIPYSSTGICFIWLDDFKQINDLYGHPVGNEILSILAKKIQNSGAEFTFCARVGDDEFLATKAGTPKDVSEALEVFFKELSQPFKIGDILMYPSVSVGITFYPEQGQSVDTLITNAGIAAYAAKESGRNTYAVYNPEMRRTIDRHNSIIHVLRNCIQTGEAFLMYQPVYGLTNKQLIGFEALMRIKSTELGLISPLEFIPIAESDRNIMLNLGGWVLRKACRFIKDRIDNENFQGYVAVNISVSQISSANFVEDVISVIEETGIPPQQLQLEFTEAITLNNINTHLECLERLRNYGVIIALDDFSTHSSPLFHLAHLPIDSIKIDRSFITSTDLDERMMFTNRTVIDLAHRFDIKIIAEGVETQRDYEMLKTLGCDDIQGFLLSRPLMEESAVLKIKEMPH